MQAKNRFLQIGSLNFWVLTVCINLTNSKVKIFSSPEILQLNGRIDHWRNEKKNRTKLTTQGNEFFSLVNDSTKFLEKMLVGNRNSMPKYLRLLEVDFQMFREKVHFCSCRSPIHLNFLFDFSRRVVFLIVSIAFVI